ncbi:hypothetical protein ACFDR9_000344 [Janthinobacterium sp. CG_23.3]
MIAVIFEVWPHPGARQAAVFRDYRLRSAGVS